MNMEVAGTCSTRVRIGALHRNLFQVRISMDLDDRRMRPHLNVRSLLDLVDEVT